MIQQKETVFERNTGILFSCTTIGNILWEKNWSPKVCFFLWLFFIIDVPINIYLLEVYNNNARKRCEICSKLIIKRPKWRQLCFSGVFIVNFEHTWYLFLVFLLLTLSIYVFSDVKYVLNRGIKWINTRDRFAFCLPRFFKLLIRLPFLGML